MLSNFYQNNLSRDCDLQLFFSCSTCGAGYISDKARVVGESEGVYFVQAKCPICKDLIVSTLLINQHKIDQFNSIFIKKEIDFEDIWN